MEHRMLLCLFGMLRTRSMTMDQLIRTSGDGYGAYYGYGGVSGDLVTGRLSASFRTLLTMMR